MNLSLAITPFCIGIAYLLGSIPTGYLAGKWLKGIDIRDYGSHSTGATNVLRTLGKKAGITVLFFDALKGVAAILFFKLLYFHPEWVSFPANYDQYWLIMAMAIAAVLGHSKSIFIGFNGGKSVATSIGVLLIMAPWVALGTVVTFAVVITLTQIVSLSSISGAIAVMLLMIVLQQPFPYILFGAIAGIYVIARHRSNIQRIIAGTEPKIGAKATN